MNESPSVGIPGEAVPSAPLAHRENPWYRDATRGAMAGFAGTALMSLVQWPLAALAGADPPPVEVGERLHRVLPGQKPRRGLVVTRSVVLHLAFGTFAGALYGLAAPRAHRELTGVGYAGIVWAASYFGILPLTGLHPAARRDNTLRQAGNVAAHVVFGLSLAEGMRLSA